MVYSCVYYLNVPSVYFYLVGLSLQSIMEGPGLCKLLVELVYLLLMLPLHVLPLLLKLLQVLRATQMSTLYIPHHRCLFPFIDMYVPAGVVSPALWCVVDAALGYFQSSAFDT